MNRSDWVSQILPENFQEILIELGFQSAAQVDLEVLEDIHRRLRQLREKKSLENLKSKLSLQDEEMLGELYQRLQKLKVVVEN